MKVGDSARMMKDIRIFLLCVLHVSISQQFLFLFRTRNSLYVLSAVLSVLIR